MYLCRAVAGLSASSRTSCLYLIMSLSMYLLYLDKCVSVCAVYLFVLSLCTFLTPLQFPSPAYSPALFTSDTGHRTPDTGHQTPAVPSFSARKVFPARDFHRILPQVSVISISTMYSIVFSFAIDLSAGYLCILPLLSTKLSPYPTPWCLHLIIPSRSFLS